MAVISRVNTAAGSQGEARPLGTEVVAQEEIVDPPLLSQRGKVDLFQFLLPLFEQLFEAIKAGWRPRQIVKAFEAASIALPYLDEVLQAGAESGNGWGRNRLLCDGWERGSGGVP
jgi:hypothetical protein